MTTTASDNPEDGIDLNALDDVSKGYRQMQQVAAQALIHMLIASK